MRLIDADAFDEKVRIAVGFSEEDVSEDFKDGVSTTLLLLKTQPTVDAVPVMTYPQVDGLTPTVDAVEVVRCKDCVSFEACIKCGFLEKDEGDWYCADGERKTNGDC